jgi:hypothetical protein
VLYRSILDNSLNIAEIIKQNNVKNGLNTEGVQTSQPLDYQTDSQAFFIKKSAKYFALGFIKSRKA